MTTTNGTTYPTSLPAEAVLVLERCRANGERVRLIYKGQETDLRGRVGYVGRTMGNPTIPGGGAKAAMIVHSSRSIGGDTLGSCELLRIEAARGDEVLWRAAP